LQKSHKRIQQETAQPQLTSQFKLFHCLVGSICFILATRLLLNNSGFEGELAHYFLPSLFGAVAGILYTSYQRTLIQKDHACSLISETLNDARTANLSLKQTLKSLNNNNELILDSIGEGVYGVDHHGKTIFINREVLRATGFNEADLLKHDQHELLHHTRADGSVYSNASCPVFKTRQDGKIRKIDNEIFWRKDGSNFPVEYIVTPTTEVNGTCGAVVIFRDISNQVQIEEHLAESEEQFRTLFDTSTDAILLMDEHGYITKANPATYRLFYCQDEKRLVGKTLNDFSPTHQPENIPSSEALQEMISDSVRYGSSFSEWKLQREDLKEVNVALLLARMDLGDTIFIQVNIRDISDQKKNEKQLQRAKREFEARVAGRTASLQQANKDLVKDLAKVRDSAEIAAQKYLSKSRFFSSMSARIEVPVDSIISICHQIAHKELPPAHAKDVDTIRLHGERLQRIFSDINNFTDLESKKLSLVYTAFNIENSIHEILDEFTFQAKSKNITLQSTIQPNVPTLLLGDNKRLQIIFGTLINNAIQYSEHGEVSITVSVRKQLADARALLSFSVRDDGTGIEPKDQQIIFNGFKQAIAGDTSKQLSTGIGLALCQRLVSLMGGRIGVESVPAMGSHFWFDIPFAIAEQQPEQPNKKQVEQDHNPNRKLEGCSLLLADDEFINRRMFSSILEKQGAAVHFAEDGNEAIALFKQKDIDCILMDVQMPECNGFQAIEAIRHLEEEAHKPRTPAIALTAHALDGYHQQCIDAGMDKYITKPVDSDVLIHTICDLLTDSPLVQ